MRSRHAIVAAVVLAALAAAYTVFWFHAVGRAEVLLAEWADKCHAAGYQVTYGAVATAGFPFAFRIAIQEPRIASGPPHQLWSWQTDNILIEARPWALHRPSLTLPGEQIVLVGAADDQAFYAATGERVRVLLRVSETLEAVRLDLRQVRIEHSRWPQALRIARAEIDWREAHGDMALGLDIAGVALPESPAPPLGPVIDELAGAVRAMGPRLEGSWPAALAAWRDDGGTLEVEGVRLRWGPLAVTAEGTAALDSENRPIGAFDARIIGVDHVIESFVEAGQIDSLEAAAVKIGLSVLAAPDGRGIRLPATMQNGRLYLSGFAVGRLAPLF